MTTIPMYQVDAFSDRLFSGNPAAVCLLEQAVADETMRSIAAENNLSETAFLLPQANGRWHIRWFTPEREIALCGHATLASAHVLFREVPECRQATALHFDCLSGELVVQKTPEGRLALNFPERRPVAIETPGALAEILGCAVLSTLSEPLAGNEVNWIAVLESEAQVRACTPDMARLGELPVHGVVVTAAGEHSDFASRFFAPAVGIDEDPVTGSIHCGLVPYWSERLQRRELHAIQCSSRGGVLHCRYDSPRVIIAGEACLYLKGEIYL